MKHFLTIRDYTEAEIDFLLRRALHLKHEHRHGGSPKSLSAKTLAMIFQKPSNRTRISFEVGMYQLGGNVVVIKPDEIKMGEREPISDIARVMSRYVDAVMLRTHSHADLVEFSDHSSIPVINGLSDFYHPCQALADMLTIRETFGTTRNITITFVGDGNNVCNSLINIAAKTGSRVIVSCPEGYEPDASLVDGRFDVKRDPIVAVRYADVVYTDVWTSMGQEQEAAKRRQEFREYCVNEELMSKAKQSAVFMHCLPAHRGEEVSDKVVESARSVIFEQAENRLHAQKAILDTLIMNRLEEMDEKLMG